MPSRSLKDGDDVARGRSGVGAVAVAGNVAAIVFLLIFFVAWDPLFESTSVPEPPTGFPTGVKPERAEAASRLLLVVIDALDLRTARDPALMPTLDRIGREGRFTTARVDSWIPSTVAGVQVLGTGRVPPPVSFLEDFGAGRSGRSGIFGCLEERGLETFVGGSHLWTDLFGNWIDGTHVVETVGEDDEQVLAAGHAALLEGRQELVILHLGRCDDQAHLRGRDSREYREAASWCDAAVASLLPLLGAQDAILVTSDHGVTRRGGHAGPESSVLRVPLVGRGPAWLEALPAEIPQATTGKLIASILGVDCVEEPSNRVVDASSLDGSQLPVRLLAGVGLLAAVLLLSSLPPRQRQVRLSFWLHGSFWLLVILAGVVPYPAVVAGIAAGVLLSLLLAFGSGEDTREIVRLLLALGLGAVLGSLRLLESFLSLDRLEDLGFEIARSLAALAMLFALVLIPIFTVTRSRIERDGLSLLPSPPLLIAGVLLAATGYLLGGVGLSCVCLLALIVGRGLGAGSCRGVIGSVQVAVLVLAALALLEMLRGESLSLSTLRVHHAFEHVDGTLGLPRAIVLVMVEQMLPVLALVLGLFSALRVRQPGELEAVLAGLAAGLAGQGLVAGVGLLLSGADNVVLGSLSTGALLRSTSQLLFLFPAAALVVAILARRRTPPEVRTDRLESLQ